MFKAAELKSKFYVNKDILLSSKFAKLALLFFLQLIVSMGFWGFGVLGWGESMGVWEGGGGVWGVWG